MVLVDDAARQRQPQPPAAGLGGEARIENVPLHRFRHSPAGEGLSTAPLHRQKRNLLKQLGLEDHICEEKTQLRETLEKVLNKDIDYQKVENEIEKLRKQAKNFLCEHAK